MDVVNFIHETNWKGLPQDVRRQARWDADDPPSDQELMDKFRRLVQAVLPDGRAAEFEKMIWQCPDLPDAASLLDAIIKPN